MKDKKTYLLASNPTYLHAAIERYCRFVLSINVEIVNLGILDLQDNYLLFILDTDTENLLETCYALFSSSISPDKTRIVGSYSHSGINLLDLDNLKANFERSLYSVDFSKRKNNPFFFQKISTFFKGHGEQSLLGCIGWVNYFLVNYSNLAKSGEHNPQELNKTFLVPGMQNWNEFKQRFKKYAPLLYFVGWDKEIKEIENWIKIIEKEIKDLEVTDSFHIFGNETFESLSEVTASIERMAQEWNQNYEKTSPANS